MKRHSSHIQSVSDTNHPSVPRGFTLVELLVVISIIGILTALTIPAVWAVVLAGRRAAVKIELNQLEMALKAYKEKFGEYPPDFAGVNLPIGNAVGDAARAAVVRHIRKAFPRCTIANWNDFLNAANITDPSILTPQTALTFWLGGGLSGGRFIGFSANPTTPFDLNTSRIGPFFEFDMNRVYNRRYWPQNAVDNVNHYGAIVYFRAENGGYANKSATDASGAIVYPAIDTRHSNLHDLDDNPYDGDPPVWGWINPQSAQIFSSGLDVLYSSPITGFDDLDNICLAYPTGENYDYTAGRTFDDITNFSGGTLESDMP